MKNRKGEILTSKLVGILLIVAAFVILLFVVYTLWSGGVADTQKEECSFSIRNRATAKLIGATEILPLKCKTQKICLSMSGEDCEELSSTKDNPVRKVRLKSCATVGSERRKIIPDLDPPASDPIDREEGTYDQAFRIDKTRKIGDRTFEPLNGKSGYVEIVGPAIFKTRNVRIITKDRIEIETPDEDNGKRVYTYVIFKKGNFDYNNYIQIVGRSDGNKDVTISGKEYKNVPYDVNNPPKFVLNEKGSLVVKAESSEEYVGVCHETRKQIMEVFADTMIRCHSMVGEGNLNFLPQKGNWNEQKYGLICSRIVFDEKAKGMEIISYGEFYRYLESRPVGDKSALNYLYPGVRGGAEYFFKIHQQSKLNLEKGESLEDVMGSKFIPRRIGSYRDWGIDTEQKFGYAIIASIVTTSYGKQLSAGAGVAAVVGVGLLATGIGSPLGVALLAGSAGSAVFYYSGGFEDKYRYSPPVIYPFELDQLKRLGISSFEIAP